jgi:hypothetical protein
MARIPAAIDWICFRTYRRWPGIPWCVQGRLSGIRSPCRWRLAEKYSLDRGDNHDRPDAADQNQSESLSHVLLYEVRALGRPGAG